MSRSLSYAILTLFTWSMTFVGASDPEKPCVTEGCTTEVGSNTDEAQLLQTRSVKTEASTEVSLLVDGEIASREVVSGTDSWKFNDAFIYNAIARAKAFGYTFEDRGDGACLSTTDATKVLSSMKVGGKCCAGNYRLQECGARCAMSTPCTGYTTTMYGDCTLYGMAANVGKKRMPPKHGAKCFAKVSTEPNRPKGTWVENKFKACNASSVPPFGEGTVSWCKGKILDNPTLCEPVLQTQSMQTRTCTCLRAGKECDFYDGWPYASVYVFTPTEIAKVDNVGWPWKIVDGGNKYCRNEPKDKKLLFAANTGVDIQQCMYAALYDEECDGERMQRSRDSGSCYCMKKGGAKCSLSASGHSDVYSIVDSPTPAPPAPAPAASDWVLTHVHQWCNGSEKIMLSNSGGSGYIHTLKGCMDKADATSNCGDQLQINIVQGTCWCMNKHRLCPYERNMASDNVNVYGRGMYATPETPTPAPTPYTWPTPPPAPTPAPTPAPAPAAKCVLSSYWCGKLGSAGLSVSDQSKVTEGDGSWFFNGASTMVGRGSYGQTCNKAVVFCAAGKSFGSGDQQAAAIKKAIDNGGVHPQAPAPSVTLTSVGSKSNTPKQGSWTVTPTNGVIQNPAPFKSDGGGPYWAASCCDGPNKECGEQKVNFENKYKLVSATLVAQGWRTACTVKCTLADGATTTFSTAGAFPSSCIGANEVRLTGGGSCGDCYFDDIKVEQV